MQYTPGVSTRPPRRPPAIGAPQTRVAASVYAAVRSDCACCAAGVAECRKPEPGAMLPGGNPVIAVPGHTPTLPVTTVGPVLVTAEPARTPKLAAVPREMFCAHEP